MDKDYTSKLEDRIRELEQQNEQLQRSLRESEKRERITLNSIGDGVISTDQDGKIVQINSVAQNLTGWDVEEARGKAFDEVFNIFNALTGEKAVNPINKVLEKGTVEGLANHTKLISKDGGEYQIADSAAPIKDDQGYIYGVIAVFRDVTEEYRKNQQIKENKDFLETIFQSIQDGISVLDTDLSIRYVNPVMESWYAENMPLVGKKCYTAYHGSKVQCDPCPTLRCMKTKKAESEIVPGSPDPNSPVKWLELYSYPIIDSDSDEVKGVVEFVRDITQREETKRELKRHKDLLARSQEIAHVGSWEMDLTQNILTWSDEVYRIFGLEPQEFAATYEAFLNRVHPDDREAVSEAYEGSIRDGRDQYEIEHRIVRKNNGEIRHVHERCDHIRDESGQIVKSIGMVQDITEQRESEENFRKLFENAPIGVFRTNSKGNPLMANKTMAHILGFETPQEVIEHYDDLAEQLYVDAQRRRVFVQIMKEQGWVENFEYEAKRKDGKHIWLSMTAKISKENDDNDFIIDGFTSDVTVRKEAEMKLQKSYEELETTEEELRASNEELQSTNQKLEEQKDKLDIYKRMVESSEDLMAVVDADYNYICVNNAYLKYYHLKQEEVIGYKAKDIIGEKYFEESVKPNLDKCLKGENVQYEMIREFPEYGKVNLDIIYYPLKIDKGVEGVVSAIRDITKRKQYEKELFNAKKRAEKSEKLTKQNLFNIEFLADCAVNFVDKRYEKDIYNFIAKKLSECNPEASVVVVNEVDYENSVIENKAFETSGDWVKKYFNDSGIQLMGQKYPLDERIEGLADGKLKKIDVGIYELTLESIPRDMASEIEKQLELGSIYGIAFILNNKIYADAFLLLPKGKEIQNVETTEAFGRQASLALKRRESEEKLDEARNQAETTANKFRALVEQLSEMLFLHDLNGQIQEVNQASANNTGYSREELYSMNIMEVDPDARDRGDMEKYWKSLSVGDPAITFEARHKRKDGTIYPAEVVVSKIELVNKKYILAIAHDITERKQAEEQLIKAKEKAEESDRLKSAFLANMSHEIRTPMNGIIGFSQILQKRDYPKNQQKKFLNIIHSRTQHLLHIINDLVDVSKIEANQLTPDFQHFYLNDVMKELYTVFSSELENREKDHIQLKVNRGLNYEQSYIQSDFNRFRQIMDNLLSNAIKFTEEGSVEFGYESWHEGHLLFYVKDSGKGIPKDQQEHIFERFRQVGDSTARTQEGTGLGLTISKSLVELLGGKMWMKSKEGEGSVFYFTLPYEKKSGKQREKDAEQGISNLKDKTVLLIEDDQTSREYIKALLEPHGMSLIICETGSEGYEAFVNNPEIDLILMDIKLPDADGLEITRKIRSSGTNKDVPIIAQTAYAMSGDAKESTDAGCDDYISKPVDSEELLKKLGKLI